MNSDDIFMENGHAHDEHHRTSSIFPNYYVQPGLDAGEATNKPVAIWDIVNFQHETQSGVDEFSSQLGNVTGGEPTEEALFINRSYQEQHEEQQRLLHSTMSPLLAAVNDITKRDAEMQLYLNQPLEKHPDSVLEAFHCPPVPENDYELIADRPVVSRARASLPAEYLVFGNPECTSPGSPMAVYAQRYIPHPSKFGPYEGEASCVSEIDLDVLQVQTPPDQPLLMLDMRRVLDVSNENKSNWMRYVRMAERSGNHMIGTTANLSLRLKARRIYLHTTRSIHAGEELRIGHWQCSVCEQRFVQPHELHAHMTHHGRVGGGVALSEVAPPQPQRRRSQRKKTAQPLLRLMEVPLLVAINENRSNRCQFCPKLFMTSDSLRQHQLRHHHMQMQRRHRGRRHPRRNQTHSALSRKSGKRGPVNSATCHKCNLCSKRFRTAERLARHHSTHAIAEQAKPHACVVCRQQCATPAALASHLLTHNDSLVGYACVYCAEQFRCVRDFKQHVAAHRSPDGTFACQHCQKQYAAYHLVRKHVRIFHVGRQFRCSQCDKQFPNTTNLQRHELTHTEQRCHGCDQCDQVFQRRDQLMAHVRRMHVACSSSTAAVVVGAAEVQETPTRVQVRRKKASKIDDSHRNEMKTDEALADNEPENALQMPEYSSLVMPTDDALMHVLPLANHDEVPNEILATSSAANAIDEPHDFYPYRCHVCVTNCRFRRRGILVNHYAKMHPHIDLDTIDSLQEPLIRPQLVYPCPSCSNTYKSNAKRKAHMAKHHPGQLAANADASLLVGRVKIDIHKCALCPRQYASRNRLLTHYRSLHPYAKPPTLASKQPPVADEETFAPDAAGPDDNATTTLPAIDETVTFFDASVGVGELNHKGLLDGVVVTADTSTPFLEPEIQITPYTLADSEVPSGPTADAAAAVATTSAAVAYCDYDNNKLLRLSSAAALELSRFYLPGADEVDDLNHRLPAALFEENTNRYGDLYNAHQ